MSKKKHPEHVNHERWLVSYADFITLLFAFFVVLFASGQSDKHKQAKLAQAMQTAFSHDGIFDPHARTPPLTDAAMPAQNAAPAAIAQPVPLAMDPSRESPGSDHQTRDGGLPGSTRMQAGKPHTTTSDEATKAIEQVIRTEVARHKLDPAFVTLHATREGLVVSLREAGFFASGSADLRPGALEVFTAVAGALPHQAMRVEGHTDDVPIHTAQFATNWELSTARAATVTRLLISQRSVDPAQVSAAGFAEFHPTASNANEAGRAQNRRVDIVLLRPTV